MENAKIHLLKSETMSGLSKRDIGVCGIGQFFLRYFGNFNLEMWYCSIARTCRMLLFMGNPKTQNPETGTRILILRMTTEIIHFSNVQ